MGNNRDFDKPYRVIHFGEDVPNCSMDGLIQDLRIERISRAFVLGYSGKSPRSMEVLFSGNIPSDELLDNLCRWNGFYWRDDMEFYSDKHAVEEFFRA